MMLGSDPELFLKRGNDYVSAIGLIGGSKDHPKPVKELGKGYYIQEDNVALEYNTPPARTQGAWTQAHNRMLEYLGNFLAKKNLQYSVDASVSFPKDQLAHPKAMVFGCDPDFNVWDLEPNPRPHSADPFLRSCGGHVHVSFRGTNSEKILLGRKMDMCLGLWSVINDPDARRRELYGKAGSIRFKPYGIEYRTLSNFWLKSPDWISMVYQLSAVALALPHNKIVDVSGIINEGKVEEAKVIFQAIYKRWL